MPFYTVEKIKSILADKKISDPKVTLLGLTFKANIDDIRESPSFIICHILEKEGIQFSAFDPWVGERVMANQCSDLEDAVNGSDLVVLLVAHDKFKELDPDSLGRPMRHRLLLDMKNGVDHESFKQAGFETFLLGRR
jgi:UDP-N-acetyl-D-mannosaminuronic acid dehydrogenase